MKRSIFTILGLFALAALSCGDQPSRIAEAELEPPSGPRFFEGNDREFFGPNSPIVTIRPELGYRPDLKLHDDVYWVPDEVASRREVVDESTVRVKLTGEPDDIALRYDVGMVVIHKYYPLRYRILGVEVTDDFVVWDVVVAGFDEVIEEGDIYVKMPPGTPTPVGFDVLDPWLYESRQAQLDEIREHYLDSELIGMMATEESIDEARRLRDQQAANTTRQAQSVNLFSPPEFCEGMTEAELGCDEVYEQGTPEYQGCLDRQDPCDGLYDNDEAGQAARADCEAAAAAGEFRLPQLLVCDAFVRNNIDTMQVRGDSNDAPISWQHDHCLDAGNELDRCVYDVYLARGQCLLAAGPTYTNRRLEDGSKEPFKVCPVFRPDLNLDESVELVCESICRFEDDTRDADGGASADDWGAGVGVCINSDVFPDGDKCRAGTALSHSPGSVDLVAALGDDRMTVSTGVKFTLTPVFTSAVGFTADMKISAFWAGIKIGFFAGIGIGAQTTLEFTENGARIDKTVDLLQEFGIQEQLEIPLPPILFLTFFLRPVLEVEFFAEASVQGKVVHDYFQEKSFAICMAAKVGGGPGYGDWPRGFSSGQEAVDNCDIPISLESENLNDLRLEETPSGVEVRAGMELFLGIQLVLKIAGSVEVGKITYYPFVARFSIGATFRPPRCSLDIIIAFGWRLRAEVDVGISRFKISLVDESIDETYPAPLRYYESFPLDIPGCGDVDPPEPAEYEGLACPPGPDPQDPDGNCASLPEFAATSASCFVDRCVAQDALRVSMAWFDANQDLDLYLRDPNGVTYTGDDLVLQSCGATCGGSCSTDDQCLTGWICDAGQCAPADPTFIESFIAPTATPGEWQAWVVRRQGADEQPVLFDLEFETRGTDGKRQATRGSVDPTEDGSAYDFIFCVGEDCP